jgi:phosphoglycerol transferase
MSSSSPPRRVWPHALGYAAAAVLSLVIVAGVLRLWRADLRVPIGYSGDVLFTGMMVKGVIENGWYYTYPRLGLPGVGELHDFPMAEGLHFAVMKLISLFGCDVFLTINLYFLLTFPLTALSAYAVLRHFRLGHLPSLVVSQLYTFLPYHIYRGICHLYLAAYYLVPLMIMVALWVCLDPGFLFRPRDGRGRPRLHLRGAKPVVSLVVCLLVSSAGVYYAFFGCFFLVVAALFACAARGQFRAVLTAGLLVAVTVAGGLLNMAPSLVYTWRNGGNEMTKRTHYIAAEIYGMKLTQLLLPIPGHRLNRLADLRQRYDQMQPPGESACATLGTLGSLGFLLLLARLFMHRRSDPPGVEDSLSVLNGAGALLATVGGFGALFALLVSPNIRCYNRLSVYLGFFCLAAVVLFLERLCRRFGARWGRLAFHGLLLALLPLGILDQTNRQLVPPYTLLKGYYDNDRAFIGAIEAALPRGANVFQLPYLAFPEIYPPGTMIDYDHMRGYLHSKHLHWSYGAMKGRDAGCWQEQVSALPPEKLLPLLAAAGFDGIYLDRAGCPDLGFGFEKEVGRLLKAEALHSPDNRFLFFNLTAYRQGVDRWLSSGEHAAEHPDPVW